MAPPQGIALLVKTEVLNSPLLQVYYKPVLYSIDADDELYNHPIAKQSIEVQKIAASLFAKDIIAQKFEAGMHGRNYSFNFLITHDNVKHALKLYPTVMWIAEQKGLI
jgi:hypothetical protein